MTTWPANTDRILLDKVDSTMAEAARRAPDLDRPTWILARDQTAGRGRRGRTWANPQGNFAATLLLKPEGTAQGAALRSFAAANALYDTLAVVADPKDLALKWPNDVLLNGGKVAGILLESAGIGDRLDWLAIGFGVNLAKSPPSNPDAAFPPISLLEATGTAIQPEIFLDTLAPRMAAEEATLTTQGFVPIRETWLSRAARLGEAITARTVRGEITGLFETIDRTGQLVLRTARGQVAIPAADVFF